MKQNNELKLGSKYKDAKGKIAEVEDIRGVLMLVIREGDALISTVQKRNIEKSGFKLLIEPKEK